MDSKSIRIMAITVALMMIITPLCVIDSSFDGKSSVTYTGDYTITSSSELANGTYTSTEADHNAILITGDIDVLLENLTVDKTGKSNSGDSANFYGINSAIMAKSGANVTINGGTITTDASGANGVFSYGGNVTGGDGTTVTLTDVTIITSGSNSGGIMTTGEGITVANDLTITTSGGSSAPIRSDRGGGTVIVNGGTYTSSGSGSPAIYSTADITVSEATLTTYTSQGVCIEGNNSVTLNDCTLTTNNKSNHNSYFANSILIYQSSSGDAKSGTSTFNATGGTITGNYGHIIHVTHTDTIITLTGVTIVNNDSENILLSVCDNHWGSGLNTAEFNAVDQKMAGTILVGDNSYLELNITGSSKFTGTVKQFIVDDDKETGTVDSTGTASCDVTLGSNAKWVLTEDTYVKSFTGDVSNIVSNGYKFYVAGTQMSGLTETDTDPEEEDEPIVDPEEEEEDDPQEDVKTSDNTMLYIGIAVAAVAIVAGAFLFLRAKKP